MQPSLGRLEKYGYSIGALGVGLAYNLVSSFSMVYCTDALGIPADCMAAGVPAVAGRKL